MTTLRFEPPLGRLGAMHTLHLRLTEKLVVDFLFLLIEHFAVDVTAEALRANIDWKSAFLKGVAQFRPNFLVEEDVRHRPFSHT